MKKYRLKTVPRIVIISIIITIQLVLYSKLGYSSNWYEIIGWTIEIYLGMLVAYLSNDLDRIIINWINK